MKVVPGQLAQGVLAVGKCTHSYKTYASGKVTSAELFDFVSHLLALWLLTATFSKLI